MNLFITAEMFSPAPPQAAALAPTAPAATLASDEPPSSLFSELLMQAAGARPDPPAGAVIAAEVSPPPLDAPAVEDAPPAAAGVPESDLSIEKLLLTALMVGAPEAMVVSGSAPHDGSPGGVVVEPSPPPEAAGPIVSLPVDAAAVVPAAAAAAEAPSAAPGVEAAVEADAASDAPTRFRQASGPTAAGPGEAALRRPGATPARDAPGPDGPVSPDHESPPAAPADRTLRGERRGERPPAEAHQAPPPASVRGAAAEAAGRSHAPVSESPSTAAPAAAGSGEPPAEGRRLPDERSGEARVTASREAFTKAASAVDPIAAEGGREEGRGAPHENGTRETQPAGAKAAAVAVDEGVPEFRLEPAGREARPSAAAEGPGLKPPAVPPGREEPIAPPRNGVFDQIVQRAALLARGGQSEMRIDLKPEVLGQVRLEIVTDQQQVSVRIVAELAHVREILETHMAQLKSDLQQQGLQVDRLEVAVAEGERRSPGRHGNPGRRRTATPALAGAAAAESVRLDSPPAAAYAAMRPAGGRIDTFI